MTAVQRDEIEAGLVVRLDTEVLRAAGGSRTNATRSDAEDRAVRGTHDFLVLAVDPSAATVLAVPLFPKTAPGSSPLDQRKRAGDVDGWLAAPAFYSHWQHWRIPIDAVIAASAADPGTPGTRRRFAVSDRDALQDAANWATRNRNAFREA